MSRSTSLRRKDWGNFVAANALNTGRFLDAPEFAVMHDKGNEENFFDRVDYQLGLKDSIHTNLQYTRSWFQTPNSFDTQFVQRQTGITPGITDQRSQIQTVDIAPTYTRAVSAQAVFNLGAYLRQDQYHYYPSGNPLNDLGPPNLQQESVAQQRSLTNAGTHADLTYARGIHNAKAGIVYGQTFLREHDQIGVVSSTLNAPCVNAGGKPAAGLHQPESVPCARATRRTRPTTRHWSRMTSPAAAATTGTLATRM